MLVPVLEIGQWRLICNWSCSDVGMGNGIRIGVSIGTDVFFWPWYWSRCRYWYCSGVGSGIGMVLRLGIVYWNRNGGVIRGFVWFVDEFGNNYLPSVFKGFF